MQQYSIAQLGRWIGLAIIVIGILFSLWDITDLDGLGGDNKFRLLVESSLQWLGTGGLIYLAAEILDRVQHKA